MKVKGLGLRADGFAMRVVVLGCRVTGQAMEDTILS